MKNKKLQLLEDIFLEAYPQGFQTPEIQKIAKKHNLPKMHTLAKEYFAEDNLASVNETSEHIISLVSKSSMVSLFEKPKLRDAIRSMSADKLEILALGLQEQLHGNKQNGFEILIELLAEYKLAKWSLLTIIPNYLTPEVEFFIKPTTTKNVLKYFDVSHISYSPKPSYEFYVEYSAFLNELKASVRKVKVGSNAGFTGFLMMAIGMGEGLAK